MLLVGILPFGAIFVELYFIMNNMWVGKVYYMFGFLFLCYGIMIITCAAVTILLVYFLLCSENYHWQWRAFATAGASAGYVFGNALLYWISKLSFSNFTSGVLYIGYSALISFLFFILTGNPPPLPRSYAFPSAWPGNVLTSELPGTIGFFSSWAFVHKIYGSIKID